MPVHHFELDDTAFVHALLHFFGVGVSNHDLLTGLSRSELIGCNLQTAVTPRYVFRTGEEICSIYVNCYQRCEKRNKRNLFHNKNC